MLRALGKSFDSLRVKIEVEPTVIDDQGMVIKQVSSSMFQQIRIDNVNRKLAEPEASLKRKSLETKKN